MSIFSWSAKAVLVVALLSWSTLPSEAAKGGGGGGGGGRGGGGGGGSRGGGSYSRGSSGSWGHNSGNWGHNNNGQHHNHGAFGYGYWPGFGYGYYYPGYGFSTTPNYRSSYYSGGGDYQEPEPEGEPATINLKVPADAEVWFNNTKTKQTGKDRQYFTAPLEAGYTYRYQLWVSWVENGKTITRTRDISISPGQNITVEIRGPAPEQP
jgi:uncharacterized protein (TIGR03000 family)